MTETTAKKGMVKYKKDHAKESFDFDYLQEINYDDKRSLKQVVETLFSAIKKQNELLEQQAHEFEARIKEIQEQHTKDMEQLKAVFGDKLATYLKGIL
jgi:predicted  nucleic acid-binding Zn-ribbon protein